MEAALSFVFIRKNRENNLIQTADLLNAMSAIREQNEF